MDQPQYNQNYQGQNYNQANQGVYNNNLGNAAY